MSFRDEIFRSCESAVDYNRYISKCIESTCDCMKSSKEEHDIARKQCKCDILGTFVRECIASKPNLDIPNWRLTFGCGKTSEKLYNYLSCIDIVSYHFKFYMFQKLLVLLRLSIMIALNENVNHLVKTWRLEVALQFQMCALQVVIAQKEWFARGKNVFQYLNAWIAIATVLENQNT